MPLRADRAAWRAGRSPGPSPSRAAARTEARSSWPNHRRRRTSGAANACPIPATARPSRASRRDRGDAARSSPGSTATALQARCRPARRATRSTARSGTSRPSAPACRPGSSPGSPRRDRCRPPTRSASARRRRWREAAASAAQRPLLKLKLGGDGDLGRVSRPCARAAPDSAARSSTPTRAGPRRDSRREHRAPAREAGVELIEQPLPAGARRRAARRSPHPSRSAPTKACHDARRPRRRSPARYDAVNIKLDKTGGLTEALACSREARGAGFDDHGRLHGRHLARHGAGDAGCAARRLRRSRRPAAPARATASPASLSERSVVSRPSRRSGAERRGGP